MPSTAAITDEEEEENKKLAEPVNVVILYTSIQLNYDRIVDAMRRQQRRLRPSV